MINNKMQLYFLLAAVLPTVILGSPVTEGGQLPSLGNFISFVPQEDLAPNPDQIAYADTLQSQISNDQTFQENFALPDQQTEPSSGFDMALAPNSQGEKVDDETAEYRGFNCQQKYSVCCQGRDLSISSQHMPCSKSKLISRSSSPSPSLPTPQLSMLVTEMICVPP